MRNFRYFFLAVVFVAVAIPALAAEMGGSRGHDLDALWAKAQENHDLETEDAVLLLESREVMVDVEGSKSTTVHTVVWINSSVAIRGYADLRVPWDTATSELQVEVLRTWMDNRWWPDATEISETAVVHTLPHALRTAHDYTTMRETMLLHDGVELPCIMETVYTITEELAFEHTDGLFVMPQRDPAVRVELTVRAPTGVEVKHEALNDAPEPTVDNTDGQLVMTWAMDNVAPLKMPITAAPERYEPAVVWSTWPDWETVAQTWHGSIAEATQVNEALEEEIKNVYADSPDWAALAGFPDWINEAVRSVHYGAEHWVGRPRTSTRTWETGYGHAMDRLILMNAWGGTDSDAKICWFVGEPGPVIGAGVPRLGGLGRMMFGNVGNPRVGSYYDPDRGSMGSKTELWGRPAYLFGAEGSPFVLGPEEDLQLVLTSIELTLEAGEEKTLKGRGSMTLRGMAVDYLGWTNGSQAMENKTGEALKSVLPQAELGDVNPSLIGVEESRVVFTFTIPVPETEDFDIKSLVVGSPAHGVASMLPVDVHIHDQDRESPIMIGAPISHVVKVRFKSEDLGVGALPEAFRMDNEAGHVGLEISEYQGWTTILRSIHTESEITPENWPALRALLLEEQDPRHGTIIFE